MRFAGKKDIAAEVVALDAELLSLSFERFQAGLANEQEVDTFQATLDADKAVLDIAEIALKQTIYSLAVLLGRIPESVIEDFQIKRPIPYAGGKVPAGLPGDLLRRRPDIRVAERELAAAAEEVWVAVANMLPQLSLTGSSSTFAANPLQGANVGWSSDTFSKLFSGPSLIWGIGGIITWPVFDFGKRQAAVNVQVSLKYQAYTTYQKTVVAALQEVEQALTAYFNEEKRLDALTLEVRSNKRILDLTSDQFESGLADYTQVLEAREIWLASLNILTDSRQALTTDLIAIYKALGGDW